MKPIKSLALALFLAVSTSFILGWNPSPKNPVTDSKENVIVLLKFKAQPDKGDQTVKELNDLFKEVRKEPNFVSIKLHVDPQDATNILLYEEWEDESYYNNEHMNTAHLQAFMKNSQNFLEGPPEITFWTVKGVFN